VSLECQREVCGKRVVRRGYEGDGGGEEGRIEAEEISCVKFRKKEPDEGAQTIEVDAKEAFEVGEPKEIGSYRIRREVKLGLIDVKSCERR
jgi:hypothetical protein